MGFFPKFRRNFFWQIPLLLLQSKFKGIKINTLSSSSLTNQNFKGKIEKSTTINPINRKFRDNALSLCSWEGLHGSHFRSIGAKPARTTTANGGTTRTEARTTARQQEQQKHHHHRRYTATATRTGDKNNNNRGHLQQ